MNIYRGRGRWAGLWKPIEDLPGEQGIPQPGTVWNRPGHPAHVMMPKPDTREVCRIAPAPTRATLCPQGTSYQEYFASFATPQRVKQRPSWAMSKPRRSPNSMQTVIYSLAPSLSESFGLIYLEAMAHARPVVAFHTGAVPEVVAHSETGILVERGSTSRTGERSGQTGW